MFIKAITKRRQTIGQGMAVVVDQAILSGGTFLTGVLLARAVAQEAFGVYVLAQSILMIVLSVQKALFGFPYTIKSQKLNDEERAQLRGSLYLLSNLLLLLLMPLIGYLMLHSTEKVGAKTVSESVLLVSLWSFTFVMRDFLRSTMLAELRVWTGLVSNIVSVGLQVALLGLLYYKGSLDLPTALGVIVLTQLIGFASMAWVLADAMKLHLARLGKDFRFCFASGKWFLANAALYAGSSQAVPWIIAFHGDGASVAVYGVCSTVAAFLAPLLKGLNDYLLPRLSKGVANSGYKDVWRMTQLAMLVVLLPQLAWFVLVAVWGDTVVPLLFSKSYSDHGLVLIIVVGRMVVEALSSTLSAALNSLDKTFLISAFAALSALVILAGGMLGYRTFGLAGLLSLSFAASLFSLLAKYLFLKRVVKRQP